ncbi:MAG: biopolymer transporter ExbD [Fibromonadaceae bacterium]|jgi:biopolymer transport protein ExbD|nr:biopolymer transporter ExbD [Fibromonadaceae bacterium]
MASDIDFLEMKPRQKREATIDIGPLMDMVFILLIFFVVTSTFTRETGVEVTKPQAQTASQLEKENILIAITRDGSIHIDERQVDLAGLSDVVKGIIAKNPEREAVLIADKEAVTGKLVSVIDACTLAGVKKISIAALNK